MARIIIKRNITAHAWTSAILNSETIEVVDRVRPIELVPGQRIAIHREDDHVFRTKRGWIQLPPDAWAWE